jgi:hypothetical protein
MWLKYVHDDTINKLVKPKALGAININAYSLVGVKMRADNNYLYLHLSTIHYSLLAYMDANTGFRVLGCRYYPHSHSFIYLIYVIFYIYT